MPCYDPRSNQARHQSDYKETFEKDAKALLDVNRRLEASICAIFSELERRGIAYEVAVEASRNGLIDLTDFWANHQDEDRARIGKQLHRLSKDEQDDKKKRFNFKIWWRYHWDNVFVTLFHKLITVMSLVHLYK